MTISALELGRQIAGGKLDPVELLAEVLEKIDASPHRDEIFSHLSRDRSMLEAEAAYQRQKTDTLNSPLDGVPISWKDLFDSKNIATEAGSPFLKGRKPEKDCKLLERATKAGLVCVGKTHMSELAFSGLGINPNTATPPNIHGHELAPGGSSSGAAASVAFGMVPIGIGSDTGGSVRIPAAWNDLVGLKTTATHLSNEGVVPLCKGFDTAGPLATTVADASLITSIMAGEPANIPEAKPLSECRFLVNRTIVMDDLGDEQETGFHEAVDALGKAGAKVEYGEIEVFNSILPLGPLLFPYEAWQEWGAEIEANPGVMFEPVEKRFLSGQGITEEQYKTAWDKMLELRKEYEARVEGYDAVLSPTVCIGPPNVATLLDDIELFQKTNLLALRNTRFGNMFGLCGLTLPTSKPAAGILFSGSPFTEENLVRIGLSAEKLVRGPLE